MEYLYYYNIQQPRFRLVLKKDGTVPADIVIDRWAPKEVRPAERVNRDVLSDIEVQGYALYELDVEFSHIDKH